MRLIYLTHSLESCWNHGNAHFLRGVLRALAASGHDVQAVEPVEAWSRTNLLADAGVAALDGWRAHYPGLASLRSDAPETLLDGADVVIVHEWTRTGDRRPAGGAAPGRGRRGCCCSTTRITAPSVTRRRCRRSTYPAMTPCSRSARPWPPCIAAGAGQGACSCGTRRRTPRCSTRPRRPGHGRVPCGSATGATVSAPRNWSSFLLAPLHCAAIPLDIHGVRYPPEALAMLERYGARYHGWLPNHAAPATFARHAFTMHVPRRFYVSDLPGIPTIRVFEALASGIPLISAPWDDAEGLFTPGEDFLVAEDGAAVERHARMLVNEPDFAASLAARGLATVLARHTCAHRAEELLGIVNSLSFQPPVGGGGAAR